MKSRSMPANGTAPCLQQRLAGSLIVAMLNELSGGGRSSDLALTWEFHQAAKLVFEVCVAAWRSTLCAVQCTLQGVELCALVRYMMYVNRASAR